MITKHCLRFSFNLCPKQAKGVQGLQGQMRAEPMTLVSGNERYALRFDCKPCEMHVIDAKKPGILNSTPPPAGQTTAPMKIPAGQCPSVAVSARLGRLPGNLLAQPVFLFAQLRRKGFAKILGFEDLPDLDLRFTQHGIRAALDPVDRLLQ